VLPSTNVGDVHQETALERILRLLPASLKALTAVIITAVGLAVCVGVIFSPNPQLDNFRTGAWTLFGTIVGACVASQFGSSRSRSS
jgi:hypothetical protein